MLETRAKVVRVDGQIAMVEADQGNGCGQCNGKGCGTGKLSQLFCSQPRQFQVDNPINANVGDEVIVSVAHGAVMHGISLLYGLPLLLMVIAASLGSTIGGSGGRADAYASLGALSGLMVGFGLAKWISLRQNRRLAKPFITKRYYEDIR